MTLEFVKQRFDTWLKYAKTPNNGFLAGYCYSVSYGMANMAADIAWEQGDRDLSKEITSLWDNNYRDSFLLALREELTRQ